jgi:hypothetical protein
MTSNQNHKKNCPQMLRPQNKDYQKLNSKRLNTLSSDTSLITKGVILKCLRNIEKFFIGKGTGFMSFNRRQGISK